MSSLLGSHIFRIFLGRVSSIQFKVHKFLFRAEPGSDLRNSAVARALDVDAANQQLAQSEMLQVRWLRRQLRRYPYWREGHQTLGVLARQHGDVSTAYASCQALLQLCPEDRRALLLMGQTLLAIGDGERALEVLERLMKHLEVGSPLGDRGGGEKLRFSCLRELGAAKLLLRDLHGAREALEQLPPEELDAGAKAALQYARRALPPLTHSPTVAEEEGSHVTSPAR